ncbi:MAG: LysE family transporter [Parachlamydiales bacterium]|nr:LysE family transporter [Parachlamydiales bacterium]
MEDCQAGLGAALADMIYGSIAAFGLTIISNALLASQFWIRLIGGIFLVYLGIKTCFSKAIKQGDKKLMHQTLLKDFITTFFLTLTNPMTIVAFLGIFAALGLSNTDGNLFQGAFLVMGVFFGSSLWWFLLSEFVALFRKKIEEKMMRWINRIAGLIILGFGIFAMISGL